MFEKCHLLFKLILRATQFQKIPEYDIFQKTVFLHVSIKYEFGTKPVPVAAGQYLSSHFTFFY